MVGRIDVGRFLSSSYDDTDTPRFQCIIPLSYDTYNHPYLLSLRRHGVRPLDT